MEGERFIQGFSGKKLKERNNVEDLDLNGMILKRDEMGCHGLELSVYGSDCCDRAKEHSSAIQCVQGVVWLHQNDSPLYS